MKMQRTRAWRKKAAFEQRLQVWNPKKGNWKNVITRTRKKTFALLETWKICRFSRQQSTPFERGKKTLTRRRSPCLENWKEEGRNFIVFLSTPYYLKDTSVFFSVSLSPFFNTFVPVIKYWKIAKNVSFQILRNVFSKKSEIWNCLS